MVIKLTDDLEVRRDAYNLIIIDQGHQSFYPHNGWWGLLDGLLAIARDRSWGRKCLPDPRELIEADKQARYLVEEWAEKLLFAKEEAF